MSKKLILLVDEKKDLTAPDKAWKPTDDERELKKFLTKRYDQMSKNRDTLGITRKWAMCDRLYTPHRVRKAVGTQRDFEDSPLTNINLTDPQGREADTSRPIAYEKIQTALSLMIEQNPKCALKSYIKKYDAIKEFVKEIYHNNWEINRSLIELIAWIFNLAKYGNAFAIRYYKKTYRTDHERYQDKDGKTKYRPLKVVDFDDVIFENLDPYQVLLDEKCNNARNARDAFVEYLYDYDDFFDVYPEEIYPNVSFVQAGKYLESISQSQNADEFRVGAFRKVDTKEVQVLIYENQKRHEKHILANGVLLTEVGNPMTTKKISLISEKWSEKNPKHWEGIGICELLEMYQPLRDELANSSINLVRQRLKPNMFIGNNFNISDENNDVLSVGSVITIDGDINQVKWDRPDGLTAPEFKVMENYDTEIERVLGVYKSISGEASADTAYQDALNRESAMRRLRLPLESIKNALEDDARLAIPLFQSVYSEPIKVYPLANPEDILAAQQALGINPQDSRFVLMDNGQIIRREFRQFELNLTKNEDNQIVTSEESDFWETVPENFEWDGIINIVPMSFLPISQQLELQNRLQKFNLTFNIPTTDPLGSPLLTDENGNAFQINKVKILKDLFDGFNDNPDDYLLPLQPQAMPPAIDGMGGKNPITNPRNLTPSARQQVGTPQVNPAQI